MIRLLRVSCITIRARSNVNWPSNKKLKNDFTEMNITFEKKMIPGKLCPERMFCFPWSTEWHVWIMCGESAEDCVLFTPWPVPWVYSCRFVPLDGMLITRNIVLPLIAYNQEYLSSDDAQEASRCLKELEVPHFHHELVYEVSLHSLLGL